MKFLIGFAIVLIVQCTQALTDPECQDDFRTFIDCAKIKFQSVSDNDWDSRRTEFRDKVSQCFSKNGCDSPEYDKDPVDSLSPHTKSMVEKVAKEWAETPQEIKDCLKTRLLDKFGEKINQCLTRKNVSNVNISSFGDFQLRPSDDPGINAGPFGAIESNGNKTTRDRSIKTFSVKMNIARAYRNCQKKMGPQFEQTGKMIIFCFYQINFQHGLNYCESIKKPCSANVSVDCVNRGQAIRSSICQCKQENERQMLQKIDELRSRSNVANVALGDLIKALGQGQDFRSVIATVKQCYTENQFEPPQAVKFAEAIAASQAESQGSAQPTAVHPRIDPETLLNLRDVLDFEANDVYECQECPP